MSKTKIEHRGMKNEIQQVGYFKRKLIGGVLETKVEHRVSETGFNRWGTENENSKQGYNDPIKERGVSSSERLGIEYLKRGFEMCYIVLSQFKRGISGFRI